ncbi:unnamed protein product [Brachionus calyciflorus]|uniref:Dipeptidyl peptidase 1 n=1 Tax=Brachionus calyciflorus TaxID=104777 RepID=A0A813RQJ1_9BILA|nr:unnamed protein product [Brachionus calyciflorus]
MLQFLLKTAFLLSFVILIKADTPANCTYEDIRGFWVFHEGPRGNDKAINCSEKINITSAYYVRLEFPNTALDLDGNVGFWTIIYNQGFEVVINNRKYFAFSYYTEKGREVTSFCQHTFWGWSHGTGVNPSDWSCYIGAKVDEDQKPKVHQTLSENLLTAQQMLENRLYQTDKDHIEKINSIQSSWTATHYDFLNEMKISDLIKMAGGKKSNIISRPKPSPIDKETQILASKLPDEFDWRNVSGVNYISPIRNQGSCGSCYAFASMAMNEARLRIKSLNTEQTIFSPQDIVECSEYSQGCDGGFPYLISGKYAEDFGLVEESCNPYKGRDGKCSTDKSCKRRYSTKYHYVGGFYGACNEALMKIELARNGPLVVGFQVYDDFLSYRGGIYHHTGARDLTNFKWNPFEETNHAVLLVGYGTDKATGQDYWIVKNSWGTGWGEKGYFRIRRGNDECAIGSLAVGSDIVV